MWVCTLDDVCSPTSAAISSHFFDNSYTLFQRWALIAGRTINVKAAKDVPVLNGKHFPQRYCNAGVGRYHHHLKFHFIDRRWKNRDVPAMTGALMIAGRHRGGIHQFAHGFASTRSIENPAFFLVFHSSFSHGRHTRIFSAMRQRSFFNDGEIDTFNYERKNQRGRSPVLQRRHEST